MDGDGNGFMNGDYGFTGSSSPPHPVQGGTKQHQYEPRAEDELRQVAQTLSRTGKVLNAGLAQANEQGQRLRGAISRLERSNEWSTAERKRAEDEISAFFHSIREVLRVKEEELLRDTKGVFEVQDEDNKRRLEELVIQGQKLSKACQAIQALNEGTANATIGSLNTPLNALLEALETSGKILEREDELAQHESMRMSQQRARPSSASEGGSGGAPVDDRGVKFYFCSDASIQRAIESVELTQYDTIPPVVLVGTPASVQEEAQRRRLGQYRLTNVENRLGGLDLNIPPPSSNKTSNNNSGRKLNADFDFVPRSQQQQQRSSLGSAGGSASPQNGYQYISQDRRFGSPINSPTNRMDDSGSTASGSHKEFKIKAVVPYEQESEKGVLWYLGTKAGTSAFANPALFSPTDDHLVVLRASSRIEGDLASLVGFKHHSGSFFETDSALSSWVSVELPYPLAPTHYTLAYYISGSDHIPRNWVLQASTDNTNWQTLKVHENDSALDGELHMATWAIPQQANSSGPFRFFRIMQTGPTSSGTMFLVLSFIEFFGTVFQNES